MEYDRFNELITARHQIVVKNWPLKKFCNPSNITSRIKLELLYNTWQSGVTYFQKLTDQEMEAWEIDQFSSRIDFMSPPAEPAPVVTPTQTPADMTLISELMHPDCSDITPAPPTHAPLNVALTAITNLTPGPVSTTASHALTPDPNVIARMIQADPALQNVDPALIAMGITQSNQHQATATAAATPTTTMAHQIERPSGHTPPVDGSKRRWQEVVTPLSFGSQAAKKPRKQRKDKCLQDSRVVQGSENQHS